MSREAARRRAALSAGVSDLPVLVHRCAFTVEGETGRPAILFAVLAAVVAIAPSIAAAAPIRFSVLGALWRWTPHIFDGFMFNILISLLAMAIGTAAGGSLGLAQISLLMPVRLTSRVITQFFRNAPWLVLLFYCILLLPFEIQVGGVVIPLPGWIKATIGLSLPVMANVSEIVRGAVQSIPAGQWDAADSLAFGRRRTLWTIILPQCLKRMLPPWMNLYAILTMGTTLTSIVGVHDAMMATSEALAAEGRNELLVPMYALLLVWFFLYCYPIARWTAVLERRFQVQV